MTRYLAVLLVAYAAAVLQGSHAEPLTLGGIRPNLLLLAASMGPFLLPGGGAVFCAAGCGLLLDCLGPGKLGIDMFCAAAVVLVIQGLLRERPVASAAGRTLVSFLSIAAMLLASHALRFAVEGADAAAGPFALQAAAVAGWSALLGGGGILGWHMAGRLWSRARWPETTAANP